MKKIASFLFSMLTSVVLLLVFGISIAYATFLENDYGTITAKILIYNAWWFELLLFLLCVNLVGSVFRYRLVDRKKWAILLFHIAFIVMIAGAGITRYFSFEGSIHIREGSSSNQVISEDTYVTIVAESGTEKVSVQKKVMFSPYTANRFSEKIEIAGKQVIIQNEEFLPNAIESVVEDELGHPVVSVMFFTEDFKRSDINLGQGQIKDAGNTSFSFDVDLQSEGIKIKFDDGTLAFSSPDTTMVSNMMGAEGRILVPNKYHPLDLKSIYQTKNIQFVLKAFYPKAKTKLMYVPQNAENNLPDAFTATIISGNDEKQIHVFGGKGEPGVFSKCIIDGIYVSVSYGSVNHELPFEIHLNDFQLERYPGSHSPSSFASEVKIIDAGQSNSMPFRIYMNNILNYRGYRFFQSSFDGDEKGTILSVSYDWWGTAISYLGYFLLAFGMVMTLFSKNSRFKFLVRASAKLKQARMKAMVLFFAFLLVSAAVCGNNQELDKSHLYEFGELLVQDKQGRIEPVNTLASEVLRKLSKKNSYSGMPAIQVFLMMNVYPEHWKNEPFIKISNDELRKILGVKDNFATFNQLVGGNSGTANLMSRMVGEAYQKKPTLRNKLDKEIINVDERVNICYQVFQCDFLKAYPIPGDKTNAWLLPQQFTEAYDSVSTDIRKISLLAYFQSVANSIETGNWQPSVEILRNIKNYQREFAAEIVPSEQKVRLEIFYNEKNIFGNLAFACVILGFVLLVLHFAHIFKPNLYLGKILFSAAYLIFMVFVVYSTGLVIRWYISGHAPWSNGYETMIYIGWATLLSGFVFVKRSPITLAVTTILAGIILFVAGMSWMNPEITNLVPVLKSYWLIVHVAVITASYGFLAIGALLGLINLVLMILRNPKNLRNTSFTIIELAYIIEMTLIIGLMLLTVGAFIGAIWANESWGRYWGWDPKETWALVTVIVYSFILHLKKIPGLKSNFILSAFALVGFSSVLMTFFGVNYYLSGMHSYAQGDPPSVPMGVYWAILIIIIVMVLAFLSERKYGKNSLISEIEQLEI